MSYPIGRGMAIATTPAGLEGKPESMIATLEQARAAKAIAMDRLSRRGISGIVGVGITRVDTSYAVKVNLGAQPAKGTQLPTNIDGVPLRFEVTGTLRAAER
jgi:hypothetical protein